MVVSDVWAGGSRPCGNVIGQLGCQDLLYPLVQSESTWLTGGYFNPCTLPSPLPNLPILNSARETTGIISHQETEGCPNIPGIASSDSLTPEKGGQPP